MTRHSDTRLTALALLAALIAIAAVGSDALTRALDRDLPRLWSALNATFLVLP